MMRQKVYTILEEGALAGSLGAVVQRGFLAITVLSAIGVVLLLDGAGTPPIRSGIWLLEYATLAFFVLEYAVRLWCAPEDLRNKAAGSTLARLQYARSTSGLLDLAVIGLMAGHLLGGAYAPVLGALSLLRLLKITRYSLVLQSISDTLAASRQTLWACLVLLVAVGCMAGCVIFLVERDSQPELFGKLSSSIWWTLSSLAGSGKTDDMPNSAIGQLIATVLGLFGYMIVALPMGIISGIFYGKTQERQFIVTWSMVARVPFFQVLEPSQIASVIEKLQSERFVARRTIMRKGDKGDRMYFLLDGEIEVDSAEGPIRRVPGEFFGERALVTNEPRSATVRSVTPVKLLSLSAAALNEVLDAHPQLLLQLREAIEARTVSAH